jgi:hypothetical protein
MRNGNKVHLSLCGSIQHYDMKTYGEVDIQLNYTEEKSGEEG